MGVLGHSGDARGRARHDGGEVTMNIRTMAWSVTALVLAIAPGVGAQPLPAPDVAPPAPPARAAQPQPSAALPLAEILASVRSAGFDPLSRPVQRGPVYLVFALDRYLMDLLVTVHPPSRPLRAPT